MKYVNFFGLMFLIGIVAGLFYIVAIQDESLHQTQVNLAGTIVNLQKDLEQTKKDLEETRKELAIAEVAVVVVHKKIDEVAEKVNFYRDKQFVLDKKNFDCLAKNIYFEAGIEDEAGKLAVGQVTLNRLESGKWGNSICKVVYAKAQFSWTLYKKKRYAKPYGENWQESVDVAKDLMNGSRIKGLEESMWYHADYIKLPGWADINNKVTKIGKHIFYNDVKKG